ncbi:hypothetical protein QTI51_37215 [Variovorax sp. J22G73]|uniref:hypothetical protein n=1 Tax=unclassified Variovorax TaxID=663243 RepID=UPI002574ECF2|nr:MULTISPECIES: hypothetical protein [unclassified Variovorax]MDM0010171.1 hypothetical protein [Variovorax sp. J22R203]MDM0102967.1 hypothetical protein [Variovorax sp. J22G73]
MYVLDAVCREQIDRPYGPSLEKSPADFRVLMTLARVRKGDLNPPERLKRQAVASFLAEMNKSSPSLALISEFEAALQLL